MSREVYWLAKAAYRYCCGCSTDREDNESSRMCKKMFLRTLDTITEYASNQDAESIQAVRHNCLSGDCDYIRLPLATMQVRNRPLPVRIKEFFNK